MIALHRTGQPAGQGGHVKAGPRSNLDADMLTRACSRIPDRRGQRYLWVTNNGLDKQQQLRDNLSGVLLASKRRRRPRPPSTCQGQHRLHQTPVLGPHGWLWSFKPKGICSKATGRSRVPCVPVTVVCARFHSCTQMTIYRYRNVMSKSTWSKSLRISFK